MNILILSFYYSPDLCAGSFRTTSLVNSLRNKLSPDDKLIVLTTQPNRYSTYETESTPEFEKQGNVELFRISIPSHKSGFIDQVKSFYVYFKKARKISRQVEADIVFATSSRLFTAFLGSNIARRMKKPLYLDIRDIFVDTLHSISKTMYYPLKPFLTLIEKYTFINASKVNLVSKGFETYFKDKYPHLSYSFFTNGIDEEFLSNSFEKQEQETSKKINVVYAGNLGQGQGLHNIVPKLAGQTADHYCFEIIGDGGAKNLLQAGLNNSKAYNVISNPPVSRKVLIEKYKNADILFLHLNNVPAFKKVLPSKIFEYAATGKPILAGVSGYCKEFIESEIENAAVFHPCNADEAVEALKSLKPGHTNRTNFIQKYSRKNIMHLFALDILSLKAG